MPVNKNPGVLVCLILVLSLFACTTTREAPVTSRERGVKPTQKKPVHEVTPQGKTDISTPEVHIVKKGDTLYSIAWNYGHDYRAIAQWNEIKAPYVIYPGQPLKLQAPPATRTKPLQPGPIVRKEAAVRYEQKPAHKPETEKKEPATQLKETAAIQKPTPLATGNVLWSWPAEGKLVKLNTPKAEKGIDIEGELGQRINAAAMGDVVYSGSGLLGYGKLIIIKHNDTFLSAYAHNSNLIVKEGDRVNQGQQIAQMGQTTDGRTLLHFEIRENGKPIDPLKHLPAN